MIHYCLTFLRLSQEPFFLEILNTKLILFKGVHEIMMFHVSLVERIEVQNYCQLVRQRTKDSVLVHNKVKSNTERTCRILLLSTPRIPISHSWKHATEYRTFDGNNWTTSIPVICHLFVPLTIQLYNVLFTLYRVQCSTLLLRKIEKKLNPFFLSLINKQ